MRKEPKGFRIPIYRSLTQPIMIAGIPRKLAIICWSLILALFFQTNTLWVFALGALVHGGLTLLYRFDPYILRVLKRNLLNPPNLR